MLSEAKHPGICLKANAEALLYAQGAGQARLAQRSNW